MRLLQANERLVMPCCVADASDAAGEDEPEACARCKHEREGGEHEREACARCKDESEERSCPGSSWALWALAGGVCVGRGSHSGGGARSSRGGGGGGGGAAAAEKNNMRTVLKSARNLPLSRRHGALWARAVAIHWLWRPPPRLLRNAVRHIAALPHGGRLLRGEHIALVLADCPTEAAVGVSDGYPHVLEQKESDPCSIDKDWRDGAHFTCFTGTKVLVQKYWY